MTGSRSSDPLRTLELLVGVIVAVLTVLACAVLVGTVAGPGTVPGLDAEVCVTTSAQGDPGFRRVEGESTGPVGLTDGITWEASEVRLCDPDPDAATRTLALVGLSVWVVVPLLFFGLLWRLLRRARREGVFADRVPRGLRSLGGLLLLWAVLDLVVSGFVDAALITRMTDSLVLFTADVSLVLVFLGVVLLALAQVMAQAVTMRRDVEATI